MLKLKFLTILAILLMLLGVAGPSLDVSASPLAQTSPVLVALAPYSVLAGLDPPGLTCTGATTTTGDVGISPGTTITGFPVPCTAGGGGTHSADGSSNAAQAEALTVFGALDQPCDQSFGAVDLGTTFPAGVGPGVYCSTSSFSLAGNLNLVGSGVWIFKTVSTLGFGNGSSVTGGDPCNVWWRVGSSTTIGTTASIIGNIFSQNGANAMNTNATLNGRFLGLSAASVSLDANTISGPVCAAGTGGGGEEEEGGPGRRVNALPQTGGGVPIRNEDFPLGMLILGVFSALAVVSGVREYRRTHLPKR